MGIIEQFALWYVPFFLAGLIDVVAVLIMMVVMGYRVHKGIRDNEENESQSLLGHTNNRRKEALRQMMPLVVYPILFLILLFFGIIHRVYDALTGTVSYPITMLHGVVGFSWGVCAGLALILQLCVLKCSRRRLRWGSVRPINVTHPPMYTDAVPTQTDVQRTASTTTFMIPQESEVDDREL